MLAMLLRSVPSQEFRGIKLDGLMPQLVPIYCLDIIMSSECLFCPRQISQETLTATKDIRGLIGCRKKSYPPKTWITSNILHKRNLMRFYQ